MTHLWVRAESRLNEDRVGITPDGVADLIREGFAVTVEESRRRVLPIRDYADAGARIVLNDLPGGADERAPAEVLLVAGLLADEHQPGVDRPLAGGGVAGGGARARRASRRRSSRTGRRRRRRC